MLNGNTVASVRNVSSESWRETLVNQQREFLTLKETQAMLCAEHMGDELKYMGTATVVRDMDYMSKLLEGDDALMSVGMPVSSVHVD